MFSVNHLVIRSQLGLPSENQQIFEDLLPWLPRSLRFLNWFFDSGPGSLPLYGGISVFGVSQKMLAAEFKELLMKMSLPEPDCDRPGE